MMINATLLIAGAVAITKSIQYLIDRHQQDSGKSSISLMGFFMFLWCAGYALMGMTADFDRAWIFRNIGLLGVLGFMATEGCFLLSISGIWSKYSKTIKIGLIIVSLVDYILFSRKDVITFIREGDRTCYYGAHCFARWFHIGYIFVLFVVMFWLGYSWYKRAYLKREKHLVRYMFLMNFCIIFATILDTFIPMFGIPSMPSSGFGGIAAYLVICYMEEKYLAFTVSIPNLSESIYKYATIPVLVFAENQSIAFVNDFGKKFLGFDEIRKTTKNEITLDQLFVLSEEEKEAVFEEIQNEKESKQSYRMKSRYDGKVCSLQFTCIRDAYGEIYGILCFVQDISEPELQMRQMKEVRKQLQEELKKKTKEAERAILQAITTVANAIDAKDEYTKGHSVRVAEYSVCLARAIGWDPVRVENLYNIALLHDIGKIGVPDSVLNKPGRLTELEIKLIQNHTTMGGEILKDITLVDHLSDGAMYHHEQYGGGGYPKGLKGEEIPIEARIIGVADAFDAMNTDRVYRKRLPVEVIRNQMISGKGKQFDPDLVDEFLRQLAAGKVEGENMIEFEVRHDSNRTGRLLQSLIQKGNEQQSEKIKTKEENLMAELGENDYLTRVYTQKFGEKYIEAAIKEHAGYLAVFDIDNLKRVNTTYGHLAGDAALKILSEVLLKYKDEAITTRFGGGEFIFFMKTDEQVKVRKIMDDIFYSYKCRRDTCASLKRTAISAGICIAYRGDSYHKVYEAAGKVLYNVKNTGKNRYDFYKEISYLSKNYSVADLSRLMERLEKKEPLAVSSNSNIEDSDWNRICNYVNKYVQKCTKPISLLLITIRYKEGADWTLEQQSYLMSCMYVAIVDNCKDMSATIRFSSVQQLVLLSGEKEEIESLTDLIFKRFYKICRDKNADISYDRMPYER